MFGKLGFLGTFGLFALGLCVFAGIGLYLHWFTISASRTDGKESDIHLSVNEGKVKEDMNTVKEEIKHGAEKVNEKVHGLSGGKTLEGTIQKVETARQELTILDNRKQEVTIKVDAATKIKIADKDGSFGDLGADDTVSVEYEAGKDGNVAKTIAVQKKS
jgi:hypothetical protein